MLLKSNLLDLYYPHIEYCTWLAVAFVFSSLIDFTIWFKFYNLTPLALRSLLLYILQILRFSFINLMFMDPSNIVQIINKNPTRRNNVSKFYYSIFIWSLTCFGRHTTHHQELKTALAASGFSYVEGCWTCSWWTLSGTVCAWQRPPTTHPTTLLCLTTSTNYTSNNLQRMKNQRLPVQFLAPDDGRCHPKHVELHINME